VNVTATGAGGSDGSYSRLGGMVTGAALVAARGVPCSLKFYRTCRPAAISQVVSGICGNSAAIVTALAAHLHVAVGFGRQER